LVVDDNGGVRESLRLILRPNYEVATARGPETLDVLSTFRPDLVFVEIRTPSADALGLLQQIRVRHATVGLVVMSLSTACERLKEMFADDPFEWLMKPFFPREVEETARRAWARKNGGAQQPVGGLARGMKADDRRRYPRVKVDWPVTLEKERHGGSPWPGHLRGLGPFGAKVIVESEDPGPPIGAIVRVQCTPPDEEAPFAVNGLVWREDPDGVAIVFVDLSAKEFDHMKRRVDTLLQQPA
jgi:CheY-like chemotaxis protein